METPTTVLGFWFDEITPGQWYATDAAFDRLITHRFGETHRAAAAGELAVWRDTGAGRLAEVIVLDQFSRNIYRDDPRAFATDVAALILSQEAIERGVPSSFSAAMRAFMYMPFMHSESLAIHDVAMALFSLEGMENNLDFEIRHKAIIDRFGRYPHRNAILGRASTAEEVAFLKEDGSSF